MDHLEEAKKFTKEAWENGDADTAQGRMSLAQTHAYIAIGAELRKLNATLTAILEAVNE
jgi:hypothetical protein